MIRRMTGYAAAGALALAPSLAAAQASQAPPTPVPAIQAPAVQPPAVQTPAVLPPAAQTAECTGLTGMTVKDGSVTSAAMVNLDKPVARPGPPLQGPPPPPPPKTYCRVQMTLKPEPGSNIRIEVWLPEKASWNGKFLGTGNGGAAGSISTPALIAGVSRGYATANTDMGSSSGKGGLNFGFGIGRPDLQKDFNYRATDGMTVEGKALTAAYYGQKPEFSYFQGCSSGGSQAWEQIQRMPTAYNGVIAGAPANQRPYMHMSRIWNEWNNLTTPEATVSKHKMELVGQLATAQCDRLDGVSDGIISDPRQCTVNLKPMLCKDYDGPECLTLRQSETVKAIWQGATNPNTKDRVYWGFEPGSEAAIDLHWEATIGPEGKVIVKDNMINWSEQYQKAHPDGVGFDFDKDVTRTFADLTDAYWAEPKLDAFNKAGGKVIIYHGWADGLVPAAGTVDYYEQITAANGEDARPFARLFMVPGMGHCRGGVGPDQFDMLAALEDWVERKWEPDFIPASRAVRPGFPALGRPLCPWPSGEVYLGDGDPNDAANWICGGKGGADEWSEH